MQNDTNPNADNSHQLNTNAHFHTGNLDQQLQQHCEVSHQQEQSMQPPEQQQFISNQQQQHVPPEQQQYVPPEQQQNVPPEQQQNVPPEQQQHVPPEQQQNLPPEQQQYVPPEQQQYVTPEQQQHEPPEQQQNLPPEQQQCVPPEQQQYVPPEQQQHVPPEQRQYVPPEQQEYVPPEQQQYVPPGQQQYVPPEQQQNVPPEQQQHVPPERQQNLPPEQQQYVTPEQQQIMPPEQQQHDPPEQLQNLPPEQQQNLPPEQQQYVPPEQQQYVPPEQQHYVPPQQQQYVPPQQQEYVPPEQQQYVPPGQQQYVPPGQQQYGPPEQQQYVPPEQQQYVPPGQQQYVPPGQQQNVPPEQQHYVPLNEQQHVPTQQQHVPPQQQQHLPPHHQHHLYSQQQHVPQHQHLSPQQSMQPPQKQQFIFTQQEQHVPPEQQQYMPPEQQQLVPPEQQHHLSPKQQHMLPKHQQVMSPQQQQHVPPRQQHGLPPNQQHMALQQQRHLPPQQKLKPPQQQPHMLPKHQQVMSPQQQQYVPHQHPQHVPPRQQHDLPPNQQHMPPQQQRHLPPQQKLKPPRHQQHMPHQHNVTPQQQLDLYSQQHVRPPPHQQMPHHHQRQQVLPPPYYRQMHPPPPQQQQMTPNRQQHVFTPQQQQMTPNRQQHVFTPQQQQMTPNRQQHVFTPQQQQMTPNRQQHVFTPQQQQQMPPPQLQHMPSPQEQQMPYDQQQHLPPQQQHGMSSQQQQHILPHQQQHILPHQQQQLHILPPHHLQQKQHLLPRQHQQHSLPFKQGEQSWPQHNFNEQMYEQPIQQSANYSSHQGYQFYQRSEQRSERGYTPPQGNIASGDSHVQGGALSMASSSVTQQEIQLNVYKQSQHPAADSMNYQAGIYHGLTQSHWSGNHEEVSTPASHTQQHHVESRLQYSTEDHQAEEPHLGVFRGNPDQFKHPTGIAMLPKGENQSQLNTVHTSSQSFAHGLEEDDYRLHLLNLRPGVYEDTLLNFLEICAEAEVDGFAWATDRKSVVVSFKIKPDVSAVMSECQRKSLEGHYIEVKTVPKSRCLKVTGLSRDCTESSVRLFFENKERGGPVKKLQLFQQKQTAFVWFEHYGVAEKVLQSSPHTMHGSPLQVCIWPDLTGFMMSCDEVDTQREVTPVAVGDIPEAVVEVDEKKILVMNLSSKISEDTLRNFLESKADADVSVIEYGRNKTSAVVSFETKPDIEAVQKKCLTRKLDEQQIQISTVNRSRCVKVTGLSPDVTEYSIHDYFENKKRGGTVEDVELYQYTNTALVRFEQYGVVEKLCTMQHKLCEKVISVQIHTDLPEFFPVNNSPDAKPQAQTAVEDNPEDFVEVLKLLVKGINPVTTEDALKNFLETKADADIQHVEWGKGKTAAVATFDAKPDIGKLKKACQNKQIEGQKLTVEFVPKSRSLIVTGLAVDITEDSLLFYFENMKRSGGGATEDIKLLHDNNTAIIQFESVGVAERVCSMKHRLSDKELTVAIHYGIPGFVSADDDKEHTTKSSSLHVKSQQSSIPQWVHLVKDVHPLIFRYLNKSENEKRKLNEDVQRFDGRTRFIQQQMGMILEVSYTGQTGTSTKNAWMKQADSAVKKSIEDMDLVVNDIDIPEECEMEQMNELLGEKVEQLHVRVYQQEKKLYIVGHKDNIVAAVSSIKKILVRFEPKETDTLDLQDFQIQYLQVSGFLSKWTQSCPDVSFKLQRNQVVLFGPKQNLQTVKFDVLEMLLTLHTDSYSFKTAQAFGILKSSLKNRLTNANINCVWDLESENKVKLFSESKDDIERTKDFIKKWICEEDIKLDKSAAKNLQSADWREKRRALIEANKDRLVITEESDVVTIAGDSDIFQSVITEIDKFFEINTIRHVLVQADSSKVKFLKDHSTAKIRHIQQKFSSEKVTIDFDEGAYCCGIRISGLNEGIAKAKKEIENHLALIKCKEVKLGLPRISHFFKEGKGRDMVTAIEQNTQTVIRPKDRLNKKKSLKSWTTSAGVVSVLKGDMCHLKVDAIVFSANQDLKLVAGLGKSIAEKGGKDIQEEADKYIKKKGRLSYGDVVCTGSGRLFCKFIFHAVVPKWQGTSSEKDQLKKILVNILKICDKKNLRSIALPALGTGQGFPLPDAVKVIVETLHDQWGEREGNNVQEVILCDIKPATVGVFVKTCEAVFVGAQPRHLIEEEDEDGSSDGMSQSGSESESNDSVSDSEKAPKAIQVIVGELSKQKADVLVNPNGKDLNMSVGAVSKSLLEAGGPAIQSECKEKYPGGLKEGRIAVTTGGKLNCKEIFHGTLKKWDQERDASDLVLKTMVFKCLKEADSRGFNSIAFPALGTGKLGFPAGLSARLMFEAASIFLRNNPGSSVKSITFVIHHKDMAVKKAFESRGLGHSGPDDTRDGATWSRDYREHKRDTSWQGEVKGPYRRGNFKVDILKGDLIREKTDCIVSCSDDSFDLRRGALSKAVLAQAGSDLQDECTSKKEDLSRNSFAVTKGYNLSCKNVIHLKAQSSPREWGSLLLLCLEEAERRGMTSLSLPALGTGGQKMPPEKMASSLLYAVNKFTDRHNQSTLTLIRVVIFQAPMVSTYRAVFGGSKPDGESGQHHSRGEPAHFKRGHFKHEDQIVLCIFSDCRDHINEAKDRLETLCREEFEEKHIGEPYTSKIERLGDDEISHLYALATKHGVVLNRTKSELVLVGRVRDVSEVKDQILSKFQDDTISEHMKEEAMMVAKLVQWSYVVDDKSNPFTVGLNCRLEKAYTAKEKTIEIKDPKGRTYTVDLQKMTEFPKGGGQPIKLERSEKAIRAGLSKMVKGEKEALAGTKTVYFKLQPVRNFKGDAEDLHFRTAESQFYRLLSGHGKQYKVTQVDYVVTPHLVKQFRSAQEELKKSRGEDLAEPVLAFHGTNVNSITNICENGFLKPGDPGFKMKSGNMYGPGVYFSEFPDYSMNYISGATKLLLCQVLLGKTHKISAASGLFNVFQGGGGLKAGYDSHTSPNGKELVVFDTSRILPCYIVHYS